MRITKDLREWEEFQRNCLHRLKRAAAWAALGLAGLAVARMAPTGRGAAAALLLALSALPALGAARPGGRFRFAWLAAAAMGAGLALGR